MKVTANLPSGRQLVWDSVHLGKEKATFRGTNPYVIEVGTLEGGAEALVTYDSMAG